jgi:hypothetical protein
MRSLNGGGSDGKSEWYEVLLAIELSTIHETFFYEVVAPVAFCQIKTLTKLQSDPFSK